MLLLVLLLQQLLLLLPLTVYEYALVFVRVEVEEVGRAVGVVLGGDHHAHLTKR